MSRGPTVCPPEKPRVGFDVSQTGRQKTGCGFFAYNLIRALASLPEATEFVLLPELGEHRLDAAPPVPSSSRCRLHPSGAPWPCLDLVHTNNFFCPTAVDARLVYTLYDLSFLAHPAWSTEANRVACFEGVFGASLRADLIVAISAFSRRHFLSVFPHYPEERVVVLPLASRFDDRTPPTKGPRLLLAGDDEIDPADGFLLAVGTLEPRKNHRVLLDAYRAYRSTHEPALPLVVAGSEGWLTGDLASELAATEGVCHLGYVDDSSLHWLYRHASLFVYPSLFEGFGLPVLEAMSQGTPVVASRTTALPEVVADAGVLVDPEDVPALAQAMALPHESERLHDLASKAARRAAGFSWRRSAEELLGHYRRALAQPSLAEDLDARQASFATVNESPLG